MNIPQEKEILLEIPSHDKIVHAGFSKSQALIKANGSFVISPYRKPNRLEPRIFDVFKTSRHERIPQFIFQNMDMEGEAIEQRARHLGVFKNARPFAKSKS